MLIEAEAIPYGPAPLRGERLLVLAPHPDDEVIGCGGLVAQHLRDKRQVFVVIATDGTRATGAPADTEKYRQQREDESRRGLAVLGDGMQIEFLRFPDRGLDDAVAEPIRNVLLQFRPDLVVLPSPVEIHPDHIALSRAFCDLVQRDPSLFAELATTRIGFYEISHPLRPNTLVDITDVAELKFAAIAAHSTQVGLKDYIAYSRGLNAYRAMTLPPETKFAEGYWVTELPELHRTAFGTLRRSVSAASEIESVRDVPPISVIVRTKDRPHLLREAVASIRASEYPSEVVVVNDGGQAPELTGEATLVNHERTRGRSEAMNTGVRAAKTRFIAFLDDDDLYYPEHLPTLAAAANATPQRAAWYTDALSVFLRVGESGAYETTSRLRLFGTDFDRNLLLVDNYIPLPTLLVEREKFLAAGGFDPSFDLFEDWDFLIRLSAAGDFQRVPRVTCEIRHFTGGNSILLAAPEGSEAFRKAKLQVWAKHAQQIDQNVFADYVEKAKRQAATLASAFTDAAGRASHLELDVHRMEREKEKLIAEISELHRAVSEREAALHDAEQRVSLHAGASEKLTKELDDSTSSLRAAYNEIERLQGLLDMIFKSRTWKLHTIVEKMRGRG